MLAHLVEAQSTGLALGVSTRGPKCREVVVAIGDDDLIELRNAGCVRSTDQRMQCKRGRSVPPRELVDERADARWLSRIGHGFPGLDGVATGAPDGGGFLGGFTGGGDVGARVPAAGFEVAGAPGLRRAVSGFGSRNTP